MLIMIALSIVIDGKAMIDWQIYDMKNTIESFIMIMNLRDEDSILIEQKAFGVIVKEDYINSTD